VGTTNRDMTPDQVGRRLMEQLGESWDGLPSKVALKDLNNAAFRRFARNAQGRLPKLSPKDPPKRALENLDLLSGGFLTKGAVLLFAGRPRQACSSARLQIGRFKGEVILDNRFLDGTLWEQLDATMDALRGYLQVRQEIRSTAPTVEGVQRHDIWEYADFMKYVPRNARDAWHQRAMQQAETVDLRGFIEICVESKEWEQLATRAVAAAHEQLENISHYVTEKAAHGLARKHPPAAAKICRALAMRILEAGKSKYYSFALEHLRTAKRLYEKLGEHAEWQAVVDQIRRDHARKRGFVADFEEIVANRKVRPPESFAERSHRRWKQQTAE
jgi:hypothetical protein